MCGGMVSALPCAALQKGLYGSGWPRYASACRLQLQRARRPQARGLAPHALAPGLRPRLPVDTRRGQER